jgi:hypothetical protein
MAKTNPVFRAPTAYEEEMLRAQRQQQLAEVLRQQAFMREPESPTYQGFRAMPTPTNALARILSAYTSKKVGEKAEEAERKAREADVAEFEALRRDLGPQTQVTGPDMFGDLARNPRAIPNNSRSVRFGQAAKSRGSAKRR